MRMWKAAAYVRLSRDDDNFSFESMSITSQKEIINDWLEDQPDIELVDTYADDGYTGTNFERPGFEDMMFDINCGRINCVIVKDLSRLGRNTIKVGQLKDEFFPTHGVRFVAINDNVDTKGGIDDNDVTDFKLLFNEFYCKDISKKTKSALRTRAKRGEYIGAYAPYGYKKSEEDYHKLVIDFEVAHVVRRIFNEFADGKSGREIADTLNSENVLSPMNYRLKNSGKEIKKYCWNTNSIIQILNNEVYCGNLVQHKRENISYKLKQRRVTSKEEHIIVKNTHEPIIDNLLKSVVEKRLNEQSYSKRKPKTNGEYMPILFSGLLYCSDCGSKLAATTKNGKRCYRCIRYNLSGKNACTSHLVYEENLLKTVKHKINNLISTYTNSKEQFINNILQTISINKQNEVKSAKQNKSKIEMQIKDIENTILQIYEDKQKGIIETKTFSVLSKKYNDNLEALLQKREEYDNIMKENKVNKSFILKWLDALTELKDCKTPTVKQLSMIIDSIIVNPVGTQDRIKIMYKVGFSSDDSDKILKLSA